MENTVQGVDEQQKSELAKLNQCVSVMQKGNNEAKELVHKRLDLLYLRSFAKSSRECTQLGSFATKSGKSTE